MLSVRGALQVEDARLSRRSPRVLALANERSCPDR